MLVCIQGMSVSVLGGAGKEAEWRLQHAQHVEKALLSQQANMATIGQAVAGVRRDVQPGSVPDASFLVAAAEGVLFEGLASLLRQVSLMPSCPSSLVPLPLSPPLSHTASSLTPPLSPSSPPTLQHHRLPSPPTPQNKHPSSSTILVICAHAEFAVTVPLRAFAAGNPCSCHGHVMLLFPDTTMLHDMPLL